MFLSTVLGICSIATEDSTNTQNFHSIRRKSGPYWSLKWGLSGRDIPSTKNPRLGHNSESFTIYVTIIRSNLITALLYKHFKKTFFLHFECSFKLHFANWSWCNLEWTVEKTGFKASWSCLKLEYKELLKRPSFKITINSK